MNKLSKLALTLGSTLVCLNTAYASGPPNTDHPTTFLGPTAHVGFTSTLADMFAYSLAGEAGVKNYRAGVTLGWKIDCNQYLKVSAEYLWQKITYAFYAGNTEQWVHQGALGAAYEYDLVDFAYAPQFDLSAYISHAPSKTLDTVSGGFFRNGIIIPYTDVRRIAGSNAWGAAPGVSVAPWDGSRIGVALNYDNVRYDIDNGGPRDTAKGLGGTIFVNQAITSNIGIGASAAVRKPYTNYAANINFGNVQYYGNWSMGLFGDYTEGKHRLPDTWDVGVSADYFLDQRCPVYRPNFKGERNFKGEAVPTTINDKLLAWTADPAVYMPQVLAVTDEKVRVCSAGLLALLSPVPDMVMTAAPTLTIPVTNHFTSNLASYTVTHTVDTSGNIGGTPGDETVTAGPGGTVIITADSANRGDIVHVTVTGVNGCSTLSTTFDVLINIIPVG